jgi:hypothetical protein
MIMVYPVAANWVSLKHPTTFKAICFQQLQQQANNSCVKLEELVDPKFSTFEGCFFLHLSRVLLLYP